MWFKSCLLAVLKIKYAALTHCSPKSASNQLPIWQKMKISRHHSFYSGLLKICKNKLSKICSSQTYKQNTHVQSIIKRSIKNLASGLKYNKTEADQTLGPRIFQPIVFDMDPFGGKRVPSGKKGYFLVWFGSFCSCKETFASCPSSCCQPQGWNGLQHRSKQAGMDL